MPDDKLKRSQLDRSKINMSEDYKVEYWTKHLKRFPRRAATRGR
jgi:Protein of unknown function (DUF3606)